MAVPIPDDWDGESFCCWAVKWPDSSQWQAIFSGLIETPTYGRYWDENTGSILNTIASFRPAYNYNFVPKEVIMACGDTDIANALNAIASALIQSSINVSNSAASSSGCCGDTVIEINGGVQGIAPQPVGGVDVPIYGTQTPLQVPPGTFPPGFDNEADYLLTKCQIANGIFDGAVTTLKAFGAISFGQTAGLAALVLAAVAGLIVLGPLMIPLLIGYLMIMIGVTGLLIQTAEEMEANRQDWVCAMYEGDNVSSIIGSLADLADIAIAALGTTSVLGAAIKTILLIIFNSDTLNQLMTKVAAFQYPDADCSVCEETVNCWEFTETVEGWTAGAEWPSFEPGGPFGSVAWTSDAGGMLNLTLQTSGGNQYGSAVSPTFSHIIQTGDYVCVDINSVAPAGSVNIYGGLLIDGVEVQWFTPNTGNPIGIAPISLNTWVGQELQQIYLGYGRSNTSPNVVVGIASVCVNEVPCP